MRRETACVKEASKRAKVWGEFWKQRSLEQI